MRYDPPSTPSHPRHRQCDRNGCASVLLRPSSLCAQKEPLGIHLPFMAEHNAGNVVEIYQFLKQLISLLNLDVEETGPHVSCKRAEGIHRIDLTHVARTPRLSIGVYNEIGALLGQVREQPKIIPRWQVVPEKTVSFLRNRRKSPFHPILNLIPEKS